MRGGVLALLGLAIAAGCGEGDERERPEPPGRTPAEGAGGVAPAVERARCPAGGGNCATATGTVLYVERVDPDGDGDAHFVLVSKASITAPGIAIVDVRSDLRPRPLPRPGDAVSAAGPVYPGSQGQRQIQAEVLNVRRAER